MAAAPVLVDINREKKEIEEEKKEQEAPLRASLKEIGEKYATGLSTLSEMDTKLRERIGQERVGKETIKTDNGGSIQFPESIGFTYGDVKKVDPAYLKTIVDDAKVRDAIKKGIREIKGIKIEPVYGLRVMIKDTTKDE